MALYVSKSRLSKLEELLHFGVKPRFVVGERIGRSFADLGAEEYIVTTNNKAVSLFTGDTIDISSKKDQFFLVPDVDEMVRLAEEAGCSVRLTYGESAGSKVFLEWQGGFLESQASSIYDAMLEALRTFFEGKRWGIRSEARSNSR